MRIKFLRKTDTSSMGSCPALYLADNGHHVVQGWRTDRSAHDRFPDLDDAETVVRVPADVVTGDIPEDHPAVRTAPDGTYLVRGLCLDDEAHAQLRDLADDETAVEVTFAIPTCP
ncbi:MAG: hypothetical protein QG608_19 [Actinomycetota bacterium]|nr:hypothetical protein [Actinomycetota bacterium]